MTTKSVSTSSINKLLKLYEKKSLEYAKCEEKLKKLQSDMSSIVREIASKQINSIKKKKESKKKSIIMIQDTETSDDSDSD
jgi:uncharacterized protein (DUF342 family)